MSRIPLAPVLCLLAASAALPSPARADDVLGAQSCSLLTQAADLRADQLYDELAGNLLKWGLWRRYKNYFFEHWDIPPNALPKKVKEFQKLIPASDFATARAIRSLRETLAKKEGPNPKANELLESESAQLQADLERVSKNWNSGLLRTLHATSKHWNADSLRYEICGGRVWLGPKNEQHAVCGVIDLVSGDVSYVIESEESWSSGTPLVSFGPVEPASARGNKAVLAKVRAQLRAREERELAPACPGAGKDGALQVVEADSRAAKGLGSRLLEVGRKVLRAIDIGFHCIAPLNDPIN